jgi:hypothetical protein
MHPYRQVQIVLTRGDRGQSLTLLFSIWERVLLAGQSYREGRKEAGKQQGKEVVTGEADVGEDDIILH